MSIFGAVLITMFFIGLIQTMVGATGTSEDYDEFEGVLVAGAILLALSVLLFLGYGFGTGWAFT